MSAVSPRSSQAASRAWTVWQPLGVVLAVMPWNYPLWQVIRFAAPALMAGNTGLLKHASNVPQSALYLDDLFEKGGFPAGSFRTLLIGSAEVAAVIEDSRVKAAIADAEAELNGKGRLVIRPSGTEPLIRVMAEGDDEGQVKAVVERICAAVAEAA